MAKKPRTPIQQPVAVVEEPAAPEAGLCAVLNIATREANRAGDHALAATLTTLEQRIGTVRNLLVDRLHTIPGDLGQRLAAFQNIL